VIRIEELHKSFGPKRVLRGVNLHVQKGETLVIIGGSGCGKSILLKHIIGIMRPEQGRVVIDGVDITRLNQHDLYERRKKFGMLFQGAALFDSLTVAENVAFALREHTTLGDARIREIVCEKLSLVGLHGAEDLKPAQLSGGMRKRVGLARAIAFEPRILLYDEPTTGLDPIMADVINELIVKLDRTLGVTSVAVTHDMKSAYKIAEKIAMLHDGQIIEVNTPDGLRSSPNPIVQQFIQGKAEGPIGRVGTSNSAP